MVNRAQQAPTSPPSSARPGEPRRIEILSEDEAPSEAPPEAVDDLRDQVAKLQDELRRLKRD